MIWLILVAVLIFLFYWKCIKPLSYWKDRGVPHQKPWPLLGNAAPIIFRKQSLFDFFKNSYNSFPDKRYVGSYFFLQPMLFIRDLDLVKQIAIKDFDNFMNRSANFSLTEDTDPLLAKNLVALDGQKWRDVRSTLSPSFTASKMKFLFTLISDCAQKFTSYWESQNLKIVEVEVKDSVSRFTNDVIATSAFGISVDSLADRNNEFFEAGQKMNQIGYIRGTLMLLYVIFPILRKLLRIPVMEPKVTDLFTKIVKETIQYRENNHVVRPDMIHLLMEERKGKHVDGDSELKPGEVKKELLTDDDIIAQGILFFAGGFETVSTTMNFMSYELVQNRDVQKKLQNEIDEVLNSKELTYETLTGMKYLDMVLSETLRKWSPAAGFERVCSKDYVLEAKVEGEKSIVIDKGISVMVPTVGFHYNPEYFPNPEKFDPERFSDENKGNIVPFSYLPFGAGPRVCIAQRFALMEVKILFVFLLSKFDIVPIEKTPRSIVISKTSVNMSPEKPIWVGFQKRSFTT